MVIEGDEYDTAFFDKGPKFMHYDPFITIMTGIEFDHADIFRDLAHIEGVFQTFAETIGQTSHMIACRENDVLMQVLADAGVRAETYGDGGEWHFSGQENEPGITRAHITGPGTGFFVETPLPGRHNLLNILACTAAARRLGITEKVIQKGLAGFSGVKRRQEIRGRVRGITVMDDFAHHPTAVRETVAAVKPFYPEGRIVAVFEPRTNTSMRQFFQDLYPSAFDLADLVCICDPCVQKDIPKAERFSTQKLVLDIENRGGTARHFETVDLVLEYLAGELKEKDLVLIMSNGGFGNLHTRLLERLG
jgi:UDP-N-acetylmuramate: L-alanyl-gamma-D-glutamyl-meso-diaminopimelate ligase